MATILSYAPLSLILRIPSPDFDDSETVSQDRIVRKTRGGDLIVFRDPEWTGVSQLKFKFSGMDQGKVNQFLNFIKLTVGLPITLTDYEGNVWTGVILNPDAGIVQPGRQILGCSFEFQGSR